MFNYLSDYVAYIVFCRLHYCQKDEFLNDCPLSFSSFDLEKCESCERMQFR